MRRLNHRTPIVVLLTVMLCLNFLPASSAQASQRNANINAPGAFPICIEPITLTVGLEQNALVENYDTNLLTQLYQEKLNATFQFELYAAGEGANKMSVMVASRSKLPDVILMNLSQDVAMSYASQKAIIPLTQLIETYGYHIKNVMEVSPSYGEYLTMPDGNIYGLGYFAESVPNQYALRTTIYQPWLEKLGLEIPKTTEEFLQVLRAFKNGDPNGNQTADEIPMSGSKNGWNEQPYNFLMNAFVYNDTKDRYVVTDGQVDFAYVQQGWKQGLSYIADLCAEGLLDPACFTQDSQQFKGLINNENVTLLGTVTAGGILLNQNDPRRAEYVTLPPLTGPEGVCYTAFQPTVPSADFFISSSCQNPEAAFLWGDLMLDYEMSIRGRFGIEGEHWVYATPADGMPIDGSLSAPSIIVKNNIWGSVQNVHWGETHPCYRDMALNGGQIWNGDPLNTTYLIYGIIKDYVGKRPAEIASDLIFTQDESEELSEIKRVVNNYVSESLARFITGDRDIEKEWDAYVRELDKMGLARYRELSQQAYDRMR